MKKILLFLVIFASFIAAQAQDLYDFKEPIVWLGLDYSLVKVNIGDVQTSEKDLQHKYFPGWNELMIKEPKKFNVERATKRKDAERNIKLVSQLNEQAKGPFYVEDVDVLKHLSTEKIAKHITQKYNTKGLTGIGLVYIIEGMDAEQKKASIWPVFINLSTKEVIKTKRFTESAGGFGFRNFWAGSIHKVFEKLPNQIDSWKKGDKD